MRIRDVGRAPSKGDSGRGDWGGGASRAERPEARREDLGAADRGACAAAHKRAVMTVRLTLLLLIVGAFLFLFTGPDGVLPLGAGDSAGRPRRSQ